MVIILEGKKQSQGLSETTEMQMGFGFLEVDMAALTGV